MVASARSLDEFSLVHQSPLVTRPLRPPQQYWRPVAAEWSIAVHGGCETLVRLTYFG
jgi:hypothetical protein